MRITTLIEDTAGEKRLCAVHGLSLFIETDRHRLLMDTGANEQTWKNAAALGKNISDVDTVVISHGHYDHTGGLLSFYEINKKAKTYMNNKASGEYYHGEKYIGNAPGVRDIDTLFLTDGDFKIDDELFLLSGLAGKHPQPEGNRELFEKKNGEFVQDDFSHEQCLVITENGKRTLISGCAHNGILNILDRFFDVYGSYPDTVISGFHMMKSGEYTACDIENAEETAHILKTMPTVFFSGHCTGQFCFDIMKEIMGDKLLQIHSGDELF